MKIMRQNRKSLYNSSFTLRQGAERHAPEIRSGRFRATITAMRPPKLCPIMMMGVSGFSFLSSSISLIVSSTNVSQSST